MQFHRKEYFSSYLIRLLRRSTKLLKLLRI